MSSAPHLGRRLSRPAAMLAVIVYAVVLAVLVT
jgi:hypothetical protein